MLTDAIEELKNPPISDDTPTTANIRYATTNLGTWSSISDVDTFLNRFKHANDYNDGDTELALGNTITIQDGTYNTQWMIAGFDKEYNQIAADGTIYTNGNGICLVPTSYVTKGQWNSSNTVEGAYKSSTMHNTRLPSIVSKLQTILGSHIVNRNVLLSSSVDSSYHSNAYTWTTAYATLMSMGQMTRTFASHRNKYDDGEANYKLPIFDYMQFKTGSNFWTRGIWGFYNTGYHAWHVNSEGSSDSSDYVNYNYGVRPLIYIR